jgi:hypothetical protein
MWYVISLCMCVFSDVFLTFFMWTYSHTEDHMKMYIYIFSFSFNNIFYTLKFTPF